MDGNGSLCILTDVEELPDNRIIWCAPVNKEQVMMFKAGVCETPGIVHLFVEPDDGGDVVFPEVWDVSLRSMQRVPLNKRKILLRGVQMKSDTILYKSITILYFAFWMRSTESKELSWNDPVQVSIFCSLVVLVLFHIKVREVEPAVPQSLVVERNSILLEACQQKIKQIKNPYNTYFVNGMKAV